MNSVMANRNQRRKRAETKRLELLAAAALAERRIERDSLIERNKRTPRTRNYYAGITSSIVLCERNGSRSGGWPRTRRQIKVDGRWQ